MRKETENRSRPVLFKHLLHRLRSRSQTGAWWQTYFWNERAHSFVNQSCCLYIAYTVIYLFILFLLCLDTGLPHSSCTTEVISNKTCTAALYKSRKNLEVS